jgi:hypothetical protein
MSYLMPLTIGANFVWYYQLRRMNIGKELYFNRFGRTFFIAYMIKEMMNGLYAYHKTRQDYKININQLFDQDETWLYSNPHVKALIRRINTKYNHLINPNFEIDEDLLKANKDYDSWFEEEDNKPEAKKYIKGNILTYQMFDTFNILPRHGPLRPYATMIGKYDTFFDDE